MSLIICVYVAVPLIPTFRVTRYSRKNEASTAVLLNAPAREPAAPPAYAVDGK